MLAAKIRIIKEKRVLLQYVLIEFVKWISCQKEHVQTTWLWNLPFNLCIERPDGEHTQFETLQSERQNYSILINSRDYCVTLTFVEVRLHLRNTQINLVFRSVCTNFVAEFENY